MRIQDNNEPGFESRGYYRHEDGKPIGCFGKALIIVIVVITSILYFVFK